jgi:prolyl oligopeptidase PreP (S9A serine peptidase family)
MALTKRAQIMLANLARRGDMYARNALYKMSPYNELIMKSLAKRGDLLAQRQILGNSCSPRAKAHVAVRARFGDTIVQASKAVTADKLTMTISGFSPTANKTFGDAPVTLTATSSVTDRAVHFKVKSGPATCTGTNGHTLTFTGAGTVVVTAYRDEDENYFAATPVDATITVAKKAQTITFTAPATADSATDSPLTLTAPTSTSGLPVVLTVKSGPATIAGRILTLTGAGAVVVDADQAGNANYLAAPQVERTITVS